MEFHTGSRYIGLTLLDGSGALLLSAEIDVQELSVECLSARLAAAFATFSQDKYLIPMAEAVLTRILQEQV